MDDLACMFTSCNFYKKYWTEYDLVSSGRILVQLTARVNFRKSLSYFKFS